MTAKKKQSVRGKKTAYDDLVYSRLKKHYPNARMILRYSSHWELLVAVVLSAQCTDQKLHQATEKLFAKYRTLDDYVRAKPSEFEKDIYSTGFYRAKTKNILAAAMVIKEKFHGIVPKTMNEILQIPGVARKTANVVLGNAHGIVEGIAVDTHVRRVSNRLGLSKSENPGIIEKDLMAVLPKKHWFQWTYLVIEHGRAICKAPKPLCEKCFLNDMCPSSIV